MSTIAISADSFGFDLWVVFAGGQELEVEIPEGVEAGDEFDVTVEVRLICCALLFATVARL